MTDNIHKLSRRDFLKLATVGGVTLTAEAYLAYRNLQKSFYSILSLGFSDLRLSDGIAETALKATEFDNSKENPNFRSMLSILNEGINQFETTTDKKAFFQRIDNFKDEKYYSKALESANSSSFLPQSTEKIVDQFIQSLPDEAMKAYLRSTYSIGSFFEIFTVGSGFDKRFRERYPELVHESGLYFNSDLRPVLMEVEGKLEILQMKMSVEEEVKKKGESISTSFIFGKFLEKSDGNVSQALLDTATFLKIMARNDYQTGKFSPSEENIQWYKENILDEYKGPSYIVAPKGESELNLIGKNYHSWNLVALLQFVPMEVLRIGGIQKQIDTFKEQGLGKTHSDMQTLKDLRQIEDLLLSYQDT